MFWSNDKKESDKMRNKVTICEWTRDNFGWWIFYGACRSVRVRVKVEIGENNIVLRIICCFEVM